MSIKHEPPNDWNSWNYTCLWAGIVISLPAYSMGGLLVTLYGLNIFEAFLTIFFSTSISYNLHYLGAKPGFQYRKGSQELLALPFGKTGSKFPIILRGLLVSAWLGLDILFGGMAVNLFLNSFITIDLPNEKLVSFCIFLSLTCFFASKGKELLKKLESYVAPILLIVGLFAFLFAISRNNYTDGSLNSINLATISFVRIIPAMVVIIGNLILLTLAMPDFSQYAKSEKDFNLGLLLGLEVTFLLFCFMGAFISFYSETLTGCKTFDLVTFLASLQNPVISFIASLLLILALLTTATADLFVSTTDLLKALGKNKQNKNWVRFLFLSATIATLIISQQILNRNSSMELSLYFDLFLKIASSILCSVVAIYILSFCTRIKNFDEQQKIRSSCNKIDYFSSSFILTAMSLTIIGIIFNTMNFLLTYGWLINFTLTSFGFFFFNPKLAKRNIKQPCYKLFL